ncbi:hypothetical protein [Helicobacter pylori]|uniref:hypothetical protein n=1 Tax=Helicobacter pylori TaxID=210 RepID=UPI0018D10B13|nr:hypothetical protein [Helicobacter pylori]MBH0289560.1 hypothetical protein [Helicobacter pylori]
MAFFNIFKLNFLKFYYYRIINPNKGTDFTPTIQQEDFFQGVLGSTHWDTQTL